MSTNFNHIYFFDIGNTAVKYCHQQHIDCITTILNATFTIQNIDFLVGQAQKIVIASGRSEISQTICHKITDFCKKNNIDYGLVRTDHHMLKTNYQDSSQFGTDRFLNLLGAKSITKDTNKAFVVISCGTAITLDFYHHIHLGGMILPGLSTVKQLLTNTTNLHGIKAPKTFLGNDTQTSIGAGIYNGYTQLLIGSIKQVQDQINQPISPILTGGDSIFFTKKIQQQSNHTIQQVNNLLFIGMRLYYNEHITR